MNGSPIPPVPAPADHAPPWRITRVELGLIVAFWTFMAALSAANRLLDPRGPALLAASPAGPVALAFAENYLWAALTPPIFWLASRFSIERGRLIARVLLLGAVGVAVALLVDVAMDLARSQFLPLPLPRRRPGGISPLRTLTRQWYLNELVVYFAVLSAGVARDYFRRFRARRDEAVRLQAEAARLEAKLAEARLAALRRQLDPHFLFNTLHAISSLVERDPRGVRRMVALLSDLLRHTLDRQEQEVPLARELEFLGRYLEIMRIRFQGRLEVRTEAAPDVLDALVPNLVLQPLVENAIKHGVSRVEGAGHIAIEARREGDALVLRVRDDGPGLDGAEPVEHGLGLRNTRERLRQLYGADQRLELRPAEGGGVVAEVRLPYHTRADLRIGVREA